MNGASGASSPAFNRYTIKRLRAEIEPVAARDFLRFLLDWHGVTSAARREGPAAIGAVVAQLEGYRGAGRFLGERDPAPPASPATSRTGLTTSARAGPCRLGAAAAAQRPRRWRRAQGGAGAHDADHAVAAPPCRFVGAVVAACRRSEAQPARTGRRRPASRSTAPRSSTSWSTAAASCARRLRRPIAELVALGIVTSDSFVGLRALLLPADSRRSRRGSAFGIADAGRWALARRKPPLAAAEGEAIEHLAHTLLRRYGVVFWRLLEREAAWLPPWRDLLRVYRRLEARGDIRGGRFVAGFAGEQFALPDAIGLLREIRRRPATEALVLASPAPTRSTSPAS